MRPPNSTRTEETDDTSHLLDRRLIICNQFPSKLDYQQCFLTEYKEDIKLHAYKGERILLVVMKDKQLEATTLKRLSTDDTIQVRSLYGSNYTSIQLPPLIYLKVPDEVINNFTVENSERVLKRKLDDKRIVLRIT